MESRHRGRQHQATQFGEYNVLLQIFRQLKDAVIGFERPMKSAVKSSTFNYLRDSNSKARGWYSVSLANIRVWDFYRHLNLRLGHTNPAWSCIQHKYCILQSQGVNKYVQLHIGDILCQRMHAMYM